MRASLASVLLLFAIVSAWPWAPARAQEVQRCTTMQGETVYTDKRCEDIGAMDRLPDPNRYPSQGSARYFRGACSRTLSDLVQQISAAIDSQDVNQLASIYQWNGVSNAAANRILDQLEAIASRPLVDIVPVLPEPTPILAEDGSVVDANADGYYPSTSSVPRRPIGLRLEQTLRNSATPSRTVLRLQRSYKCFWITL